MPDAKSLLPGRAFRSEHAQLRPEPHSIASHGPDPMDPLQTTRMRNGVLYAAEWPCCHDPLRLSLGSEDPFTHAPIAASFKAAARGGALSGALLRAAGAPAPRARRGALPGFGFGSSQNRRARPRLARFQPVGRSLAFWLPPERRVCLTACAAHAPTTATGSGASAPPNVPRHPARLVLPRQHALAL